MKTITTIILLVFFAGLFVTATSCAVFVTTDAPQQQHRGWFKNPNNPHHPFSTNPGKHKGKPGR